MDDGGQESLTKARALADVVASSLPLSIPIGALPLQSKIPFKVISLREMLFHRASALASPAVSLIETDSIISGALLTRALMETVAMFVDLQSKLDAFLETPDVEIFDSFLMKCLFANRQEEGGVRDEYYTSSILSSIDRLDKKSKGFRFTYDQLSEYAHPNYNGVFGSFGTIDAEKFVLDLGPKISSNGMVIGANALAAALDILVHYYNEMPESMVALNRYFEPGWCENSVGGGS